MPTSTLDELLFRPLLALAISFCIILVLGYIDQWIRNKRTRAKTKTKGRSVDTYSPNPLDYM